ncbi:MAG: PaaI family thioesterase [Vitreoscilla sp.]|nr:PaaI family thioesterase [Vitreoscilla sp.]
MAAMTAADVPAGFVPWPAKGPFLDAIATLFVRGSADAPVFGVRVEREHCNGRGTAHGGFISTLADVWAGYSLAPRLSPTAQFSTSSLSVDFVSRARAGEWLQSETDRIRIGKRICVVTAAIACDGRLVALTRASFVLAQA